MPIAAISLAVNRAFKIASAATPICDDHISTASCSTQPGLGYIWVNSFWAMDTMPPALLNTMALELVVPWSNDKMYFSIKDRIGLYGSGLRIFLVYTLKVTN